MGSGTFDHNAYRTYAKSTVGKSTDHVYASRGLASELDPKGVRLRESRDSADNPNSTPLIVALDVTGSMGILADVIAREGLGTLFTSILDRRPIRDPHVMFMGVGDVRMHDRAPLQVSQFEADNRVVEQLTRLYLEHGGGGNGSESYHLPWYFAAFHTEHDSYVKRAKRGYLFTVGDEGVPPALTKEEIRSVTGDEVEGEMSTEDVLNAARRTYDIYHIIIAEGSHARTHPHQVASEWKSLLGEHVIHLADHKQLAETIATAIEIAEGFDRTEAIQRWGGRAAAIVNKAVGHLPSARAPRALPPAA